MQDPDAAGERGDDLLDALLEVYPDAVVVQTHRDPGPTLMALTRAVSFSVSCAATDFST